MSNDEESIWDFTLLGMGYRDSIKKVCKLLENTDISEVIDIKNKVYTNIERNKRNPRRWLHTLIDSLCHMNRLLIIFLKELK
jgi:hypothetical protein